MFLEISQNSLENTCARVFFNKVVGASNFFKKETLAQVFSCEFCEISTYIFSYITEHLRRLPPSVVSCEENLFVSGIQFQKLYPTEQKLSIRLNSLHFRENLITISIASDVSQLTSRTYSAQVLDGTPREYCFKVSNLHNIKKKNKIRDAV